MSPVRSYRSVCTERASCCGAFRSWTFPSLLTHCQPPCSSIVFAVAGGGCVLILSVFGRGLLVGFRRFRRRCQGGGSIGQSPNSRSRLAVRDAKSKRRVRLDQLEIRHVKLHLHLQTAAERNIKSGLGGTTWKTPMIVRTYMYMMQEGNSM